MIEQYVATTILCKNNNCQRTIIQAALHVECSMHLFIV